ncbi:hypothetical protein AVEN_73201-1 [Araneus ventricosus]|uniref:Uncharacterized protein n=1 Tax=Araneus ventricosus TaxID=182803 RepID=A0A4Y2RFU2_ARAVE|nr:hypothetical protein AVEN_73201-1 [Araneus ventricosus]
MRTLCNPSRRAIITMEHRSAPHPERYVVYARWSPGTLFQYGPALLQCHISARWIGRGGPVAWPPRSPDLNPLDFFFWGHMRSLVCETPVDSAEDLVARIVVVADKINTTPEILRGRASHSFAGVNCATKSVAATLSTCCEFFSEQ